MKTCFFIELNMKTLNGFERYGCFDLGEDRDFAYRLFSTLERRSPEDETAMLHMDLAERYMGLPVNKQVIGCSVDELSRNVKTITRELFRRLSLDEARVGTEQ